VTKSKYNAYNASFVDRAFIAVSDSQREKRRKYRTPNYRSANREHHVYSITYKYALYT